MTRLRDGYQRASDWTVRHVAALFAISYSLLFVAVGLAVQSSHQANVTATAVRVEARQRSAVDVARSAQVDWDAATSRHRECLSRADSRLVSRQAWAVAVGLLSQPRPGESPERRAQTVETVRVLNRVLDEALAPLDCSRLAPKPKGPRPTIPH